MHKIMSLLILLFLLIILIGNAVALTTPQVCQDAAINYRASTMVGKIAAYADPGQKYYYGVIESSEINAYMYSEQNLIVLTTGLMNTMDDDQLAFVVAHEVSHNVLGHYGKQILASGTITAIMRIANEMVPGLGLLNLLINPLVTKAFSREFELDADQKAAQIVSDSMGINVERSISALLRVKGKNGNESSFVLFSTHPPIDDRIKQLAMTFNINSDNTYEQNSVENRKTVRAISNTTANLGIMENYSNSITTQALKVVDICEDKCRLMRQKSQLKDDVSTVDCINAVCNIMERSSIVVPDQIAKDSDTCAGKCRLMWWKKELKDGMSSLDCITAICK